jgi:tRNA(Ile)-lysidine synthase
MHKFVRNLITEWRKLGLPFSVAAIVVAVSGGADSTSMLLAIEDLARRKKFTLQIVVAHFNHKLRGKESDADEEFVRRLTLDLGFEFVSASGRLAKKGNLEQNARNARYKFLSETAHRSGASIVLTAHTLNDQAETFLMNLIRGSGPDGLSAMSGVRRLNDEVAIVRPLLTWAKRENTEGYCGERGVDFRSDAMNDDQAFTRVKIRRAIIPALKDINPRIVETLARTADLLGGSNAENNHGPAKSSERLELATLRPLSKPDLYRELRSWLRDHRGNLRSLNLKHIEAIERLILSPKSGKTAELPGGGAVLKHAGALEYRNIKVEK